MPGLAALQEEKGSSEAQPDDEKTADDTEMGEAGDENMAFGIESDQGVMAVYSELQASGDQKDKEDFQKLGRHMTQARSLVNTYVVLESETMGDDDLLKTLKESVAGSKSGDAEKKTCTLIWYDQCDAGEATAQPHLRTPGLRNRGAHLQRFIKLCQQRKDPNQDISPEDIYCLCDAGKEGNKSALLSSFLYAPQEDETGKLQKAQPCKKHVRTWIASITEGSLTERLSKVRGFSSINQVQRLYLVTKGFLTLNEHQRLHTTGASNRGNFIGPFAVENWETSDGAAGNGFKHCFLTFTRYIKIAFLNFPNDASSFVLPGGGCVEAACEGEVCSLWEAWCPHPGGRHCRWRG